MTDDWSNRTKIAQSVHYKKLKVVGKSMGPNRVIFRTEIYRSKNVLIQTNLVPKFLASEALKTFLRPLFLTSIKKKVIPEKLIFQDSQKQVFARITSATDARAWCACYENKFPKCILGQCIILPNFVMIGAKLRSAFSSKMILACYLE